MVVQALRAGGQAVGRDAQQRPVLLQENFKFKLRTLHFLQINWRILGHFSPLVESSEIF